MKMESNNTILPKTRKQKQIDRSRLYLGYKTMSNLDKYSTMKYHLTFNCRHDLDFMDAAEYSDKFISEWSRFEAYLLTTVTVGNIVDEDAVRELIPPMETAIPTTPYEIQVNVDVHHPVQINQHHQPSSDVFLNGFPPRQSECTSGLYHPRNSYVAGICASDLHTSEAWNRTCVPQVRTVHRASLTNPNPMDLRKMEILLFMEPPPNSSYNKEDTELFTTIFNILINNNYIQCIDYLKAQRAYKFLPRHTCSKRKVCPVDAEIVIRSGSGVVMESRLQNSACICSTELGRIFTSVSESTLLWMKHINNRLKWCSEYARDRWKILDISLTVRKYNQPPMQNWLGLDNG